MTAPIKPDPARAWLYAERLLDEQEAERVAKLSAEERRAEGAATEADSEEEEWSVDEMFDLAEAFAAREAASAAPVTPAVLATPTVAPAISPEPPPPARSVAPVGRFRKPATIAWLLAAAFCFLVVIFKMDWGPDVVVRRPMSRREIAEADRDTAVGRCALKDWESCKAGLDEAAALDPEGESEPRVQKARADIAAAAAPSPGPEPR